MSTRPRTALLLLLAACAGEAAMVPPEEAMSPGAAHAEAPRTPPGRIAVERELAAADPRAAPRVDDGVVSLEAPGPVRARFGEETHVSFGPGAPSATFGLRAIGREGALAMLPTAPASVAGAEVAREPAPGVREWWRSLLGGLEHGVTLATRPAGRGALVLEVAIGGGVSPRARSTDAIDLLDSGGRAVARYAGLFVVDARGRAVPASMSVRGSDVIRIEVEDGDAAYPLVVDPLVAAEEAVLLHLSDSYVQSVAVSADGAQMVVGSGRSSSPGAVWMYLRSGSSWTLQASFDGTATDRLGESVAISQDGSRVVAGAPGEVTGGRVHVYLRTGTSWAEEANIPSPTPLAGDSFGGAVGINGLGTALVVGAPDDDNTAVIDSGTASVFARSGATWTLERTVEPTAGEANDGFGTAVAFSGDGTRFLVGAPYDNDALGNNQGSVRAYLRTTGAVERTWRGPVVGATLGDAIAVNAAATYAVLGAPDDVTRGTNGGNAFVVTRSASWSSALTALPADPAVLGQFGDAVAIDSNADRIAVGASFDDLGGGNTGSVSVFLRSGTAWALESTVTHTMPSSTGFGTGVALSGSGAVLVAGDFQSPVGSSAGRMLSFGRTGTAWSLEQTLHGGVGGVGRPSISVDGAWATAAGTLFRRSGVLWTPAAHSNSGSWVVAGGGTTLLQSSGTAWSARTWNGTTLGSAQSIGTTLTSTEIAVADDGSRVVIGSDTAMSNRGTVEVWRRVGTTWSREAELLPADIAAADRYGTSVAMSSDGMIVAAGSPFDDTPTTDAGSIRVFSRASGTWQEVDTLVAADGAANDQLGSSVAISAGAVRIAAGASRDDVGGNTDAGSVRVFLASGATWSAEATLTSSTASTGGGDYFGSSVAISREGARIVGGAPNDDPGTLPDDVGTAIVFVRSGTTWSEAAVISAPDAAMGDLFGSSVALSGDGDRAVVAVASDDVANNPNIGSVRVVTLAGSAGDPCALASQCATGFCVDGVCCTTACAGGTGDCQACSAAAGGATNGTCTGLTTAVVCNASTGGCDPEERCTVGAAGPCPTDVRASAGTECRAAGGPCDVAEVCDGAAATCPGDALLTAGSVCRPPVGACDAAETCTGSIAACPIDGFASPVTLCRPALGACDLAETCTGTSPTCPTDGFATAGLVCAPSGGGGCDRDDVCSGTSPLCPARYAFAGTECRAAVSACDDAELCDGATPSCPADAFAPASRTCAPSSGADCDAPDHCSGTSADCVETFLSGVECRPAAGACDLAESCTGSVATCPPDLLVSAGINCGGTGAGSCSSPGTCNGTTPSCPGATPFPSGTLCLAAEAGNPCDVDDFCDGVSDACQPRFSAAGTECAASGGDVCDAPDVCAGTSADCVATFLSGVSCRPAAGACDAEEVCSGTSASCPADGVESSGMICRASIDTTCDPAEACDGTSSGCPGDVNGCLVPDAGPAADGGPGPSDAGPGLDAARDGGSEPDAAVLPAAVTGCACRAGHGRPTLAALLLLVVVGLAWRTVRRAARGAATSRRSSPPDSARQSWRRAMRFSRARAG